jgi:hypothetical protein
VKGPPGSEDPGSAQPAAGLMRRRGERWVDAAARIGDAYGLVLLLVLTTFILTALVPESGGWVMLPILAVGVTSVVALTSSGARPTRVRRALVLAIVWTALTGVAAITDQQWMFGIAFAGSTLMLGYAMGTVLGRVVTAHVVSTRTLLGAISVYASLGLLFTFLFRASARFQGGAFFQGVAHATGTEYVFFSYTTLTTTGYGNLIPAHQAGQIFSVLEMLMGQVFLVTLVAGLVSFWRPGRRRDPAVREAEL